jgi:hypothetical protein
MHQLLSNILIKENILEEREKLFSSTDKIFRHKTIGWQCPHLLFALIYIYKREETLHGFNFFIILNYDYIANFREIDQKTKKIGSLNDFDRLTLKYKE